MSKKKHRPVKRPEKRGLARCMVCEAIIVPGGYAGTGMCGPCATGEAATIDPLG